MLYLYKWGVPCATTLNLNRNMKPQQDPWHIKIMQVFRLFARLETKLQVSEAHISNANEQKNSSSCLF